MRRHVGLGQGTAVLLVLDVELALDPVVDRQDRVAGTTGDVENARQQATALIG